MHGFRRNKKSLLCKFFATGYCYKTADECDFGHFKPPNVHTRISLTNQRSPSPKRCSRSISRSPDRFISRPSMRRRSRSRSPRNRSPRSRSPRKRSLSRSRSPKRRLHSGSRSPRRRATRSRSPKSSRSSRSPHRSHRSPISKGSRSSPRRYRPQHCNRSPASSRDSRSSVRSESSPKRFVSTYNDPLLLANLSANSSNPPTPGFMMSKKNKTPPFKQPPNENSGRFNYFNHAKILLENSLKNQLETADFSLLGPVPDQIKCSFECWLWQKE